MSRFGTHCTIHNDHLQQFGLDDLDDKGFYHCDVCKRPIMVLHNGDLHHVAPVATISDAVEVTT